MRQETIAILEIDDEGNMHGLYTDEIDLFSVGLVTNVRKASNVEFNEVEQTWEVISMDGEVLYNNPNRNKAIEWEIGAFSPGGVYCEIFTRNVGLQISQRNQV